MIFFRFIVIWFYWRVYQYTYTSILLSILNYCWSCCMHSLLLVIKFEWLNKFNSLNFKWSWLSNFLICFLCHDMEWLIIISSRTFIDKMICKVVVFSSRKKWSHGTFQISWKLVSTNSFLLHTHTHIHSVYTIYCIPNIDAHVHNLCIHNLALIWTTKFVNQQTK